MLKLTLLCPKKTKESWLEEAISEYEKRLQGKLSIHWLFVKDEEQLIKKAPKDAICLCPQGEALDSQGFTHFLASEWQAQGSSITFIIGGPTGIPQEVLSGKKTLSLSKLTFTHQMVRLIFIEQVYRALEIMKGSGYHK